MARVRIPDQAVLKNWDDVNLTMKEIGECEADIEQIEAGMNAKIQDAKLEAELKAKPIQDRIKLLESQIKVYVESNKHEIKGKTKNLNFGKTGFRLSTKIVISKAADVIKNLRFHGMTDCIIVKESVNKETLKNYPDADIIKVGARKEMEDVFWYEIDREKLKSE